MSLFGTALAIVIAVVVALPRGAGNPQGDEAAKVYAAKCAPCHGTTGAGNGPAAAAFNPKPTDFTSAEFRENQTDEQVAAAIKDGKGAMPSFGKELSADAIKALVAYLRSFESH